MVYGEINRKPCRYSTNFTPYPSYEGSTGGSDSSPTSASKAVVQSNPNSPANSQSTRNTRRRNRSWSSSLFHTGLMLLFMFLSTTATEGFKDWSEITHPMYTPNCNLHPQMPIYMMSGKKLFPSREMECNLTRNQGVCNIMERNVHKVRETNLAGVCIQGKLAILEDLHPAQHERPKS